MDEFNYFGFYSTLVNGLKRWTNDRAMGLCPIHDDHNPSFLIDLHTGRWHCFAGCGSGTASQFAEYLGVEPPQERGVRSKVAKAVYDYCTPDGRLLFQVVRFSGKKFRQRRPDGKGGWLWNLNGVETVPYRLPDLKKARAEGQTTVWIAEGEKDVDRLWEIGLPATCNPGGAGKWKLEYSRTLVSMGFTQVYICPDNDSSGTGHAHIVAQACGEAGLEAYVLKLPGLPEKGDVSDWLNSGHTRGELQVLGERAPLWMLKGSSSRAPLVKGCDLDNNPLEYLIDEVLPHRMFTLLSGRDKLGKTLLALEMAKAVLQGDKLFDEFHSHRGKVAAYLLDDPENLIDQRLNEIGIKYHPDLWVSTSMRVNTTEPMAFLEDLELETREKQINFVIIDALYLLIPASRNAGNDSALMQPLMRELNSIVDRNKLSMLVVCHDNKTGLDVAGSHVIRAAAKVILRLKLPREERSYDEDDDIITPLRVLSRESKMAQKCSWYLEQEGDKNKATVKWHFRGNHQTFKESFLKAEILSALQYGPMSVEDLRKYIKKRKWVVVKMVDALIKEGQLIQLKKCTGERGRPKNLYVLADSEDPDFCSSNCISGSHVPERKSGPKSIKNQEVRRKNHFRFPISTIRGKNRNENQKELWVEDVINDEI